MWHKQAYNALHILFVLSIFLLCQNNLLEDVPVGMWYYLIFNLSIGSLNLLYTKKQVYSQYILLVMYMTRNMILYNEINPLTND